MHSSQNFVHTGIFVWRTISFFLSFNSCKPLKPLKVTRHMQVNSNMLFHYLLWNRKEIKFFGGLEKCMPLLKWLYKSVKQTAGVHTLCTDSSMYLLRKSKQEMSLSIDIYSFCQMLICPRGHLWGLQGKIIQLLWLSNQMAQAQILDLMTRWEKEKQSPWSSQHLLPSTLIGETGFWLELSWMWRWRKVTFKNCFFFK